MLSDALSGATAITDPVGPVESAAAKPVAPTPGNGKIALSWDAPDHPGITGWQIRLRKDGGSWMRWDHGYSTNNLRFGRRYKRLPTQRSSAERTESGIADHRSRTPSAGVVEGLIGKRLVS